MNRKIKNIMLSKDPENEKIEEQDKILAKVLKKTFVILMILGFIIAAFFAFGVANHYNYDSDITINAFGLMFEINSEEFPFVSSFLIFLYVFLLSDLCLIMLCAIILAVLINWRIKMNIVNNTYKTAKLLELIAETQQQAYSYDITSSSEEKIRT
ncbi:MAG: hypothetical protein IJP34_01280 [Clostridia bacterium]|nr:hypothetical protein [Clostridia bacterium]